MTLTIVPTPGSANANAYVTLVEAEAYVETLVHSSDWAGKSDAQKNAAIVSAARWLDTLSWKGVRSAETQSLAWPRCESLGDVGGYPLGGVGYLVDQDGFDVPNNTIPTCIKNANAEFALRLLGEDRAADAGGLVPSRLQSGKTVIEGLRRSMIPASVYDLVRNFLASEPGVVRVVRS